MKHFLAWLVLALASYGGLAAAYHLHLDANPRRILVVVDSSQPMQGMLGRVDVALDAIAAGRYREFALFTDRSRVHGWAGRFSPGRIKPYGPRDLSRIDKQRSRPEFDEADEVILVTNAGPDETAAFGDWTIHRLN